MARTARPLPHVTLAFTAGVAAGSALPLAPALPLAAGAAALAAAGWLAGGRRPRGPVPRHPAASAVLLLLSVFAAGVVMAGLAWQGLGPGPADLPCAAPAEGEEGDLRGPTAPARRVEVAGRVVSEPRRTRTGCSFLLRADGRGRWWPAGEILYVSVRAGTRPAEVGDGEGSGESLGALLRLAPGQRVVVSGLLARPRPPGNPGQFDFPRYLAVLGVRYVLSAREGGVGTVFRDAERPGPGRRQGEAGGGAGGPVRTFASLCRAARERLRAAVAANLPAEQAALLDGLLFGDTSRLPPETVRDFRRSGVFHILAVSGSNVAFVAGGFWLFARPFLGVLGLRGRRREAVLWPATALVLAGYAVMTGLGPSVVRATLMAEAGLLYLWLGRRRDVTGPLCLAALVMLCRRPLIILDPGFQLSYAATLGILYIYPHLWRRGRRSGGSGRIASVVLQAVLVSAAAQAAVAPVLAWHFGEVSLAGLLANAAVVPLSGLALTAGLGAGLISCLAGAAAGPVGQALAAPAFAAASVLLRLMAGIAGVFASLPLASVITGRPALWGVVLYYLALVWVVRGAGRGRAGRRVLLCVLVAVAAGTGAAAADAAAGALAARGGGSPGLEVVFLDVGQGDSVLVLFPGGKSLLVDGGPAGAGERVVLPYLRWRGVRRIDWVVVSHLHDDHIGGLVEVVADPSLAVGEVVVAAGGLRCREEGPPLAEALLQAVRARGIPVREVRPGDRLVSPEGVTAAVLWPPAGGLGVGASQAEGRSPSSLENDRSLVLRLVSGPASFLLPGDLEETGERALLAFLGEAGGRVLGRPARSGGEGPAAPSSGTGALDVLVLKVGHHGSANATSEEFLAAVTPACAVVCVGPNPFGHPAPETLSRLKEAGTVVFVTRDDGAVTFDVRGRVVCVGTFLSGRRFEWLFAPEGAARAGDEGLAGLAT